MLTEEIITEFILSFEGKRVTDLLSGKPTFANADYYFPDENILIELKALQKDLFAEEDLARNEKMIDTWLSEKKLAKADIIPVLIGLKELPEACYLDVFGAVRKTLQRIVGKAHKQLIETKKVLGNDQTKTMLIVCNDGNYFLSHDVLFSTLENLLSDRKEIHIDCLIYFTLNQLSKIEGSELEWIVWLPSYARESKEGLQQFVNELGAKYFTFCTTALGITDGEHRQYPDQEEGNKVLKQTSFIPKQSDTENQRD